MLKDYKTIWIDTTDLMAWSGYFTGIQRVEYNLITRFRQFDNVKFFALDHDVLLEIDFDVLEQEIEAETTRSDSEDEASIEPPLRSGPRRFAKRSLGKVARATPFVSIETAVKTYDTIAHQTKNVVGSARSKVEPSRDSRSDAIAAGSKGAIEFDTGDLVLVLGGNWHIDNYMQRLGRKLRRTNGITFGHVIYDLIPAIRSNFFPELIVEEFRRYIELVLEDAHVCFSISENTKSDAIDYASRMGITPPPIHTFRLGDQINASESRAPSELTRSRSKGREKPDEFIFCPGTLEVRKNHQSLYHAYRLAAERGLKLPHLVIAGKLGWLSGDVVYQIRNDTLVRDSITILTSCEDSEFAWLYSNSLFTVYPSLYEGWGLPVAESLQYGKLCVASNASSIPEIGGDLVEYFSPDDTGEIMEKIFRFSSDRELLKKRQAQIEANYVPANWDDAFNQVVGAINTLT